MTKAEKRMFRKKMHDYVEWLRICLHFFPDLSKWLDSMNDPRDWRYTIYTQATLVGMCILKNNSSIVSMQEMNHSFNEEAAIKNLGVFASSPDLQEMPDWQTANNYFERLSVGEMEGIRRRMVSKLLRSKQFDRYKFKGCWKLIIDGTGTAYFKERHCEHDLVTTVVDEKTGKKKTYYYHKVLEAKLVLAPNVVISIDTEFIENENEEVSKQDCELKAAERLLKRIREQYPKLPICILGDGLYATMPFMELCKSLDLHYILNLKEGRQKTLYDDFKILIETDGYRFKKSGLCGLENGRGAYRNGMEKISGKDQPCNVFEYRHKVKEKGGEIKEVCFVWVTDMKLSEKNLEEFIYTGRDRWKIENEGFNNQKNGIYKIEHLCSRHPNAMKIHYLITQISDIIMQLYRAFNKILNVIKTPIKDVARRIGEFFWGVPIKESDLEYIYRKTALRLIEVKT